MSRRHPYSIGPRPDPAELSVADAPEESWWWVPVAVVATAVPVSVLATGLVTLLGVVPAGRIVLSTYWAFVVGCWLFSPLAVHLDGRYVQERAGWVPSAYYYAVFVPGLGTLVAAAYVVQRYRKTGFA